MDGRRFVAMLAGGVLATPLAAKAQQAETVWRIGLLFPEESRGSSFTRIFEQALRELGYIEGRNVAFEHEFAQGARALRDRRDDVPRHGHAVLAGESGDGDAEHGVGLRAGREAQPPPAREPAGGPGSAASAPRPWRGERRRRRGGMMAMLSRRAFVAGSAAMMLAPLPSRAQHPTRPYRVGCLWPVPAPAPRARATLEAALRYLGWHPGTDVLFEHRFADGQADVARLAASLVSARVDVILAFTPSIIAAAASATPEVPIVMVAAADPVGSGFAASLARPGKNLTGISVNPDLLAKNLEILKDLAPGVKRVAVLRNPDAYFPTGLPVTTLEATARALQLALLFSDVRNRVDIERVARGLGQAGVSAVFALPDVSAIGSNGDLIAVLALMHRLPALFGDRWPVVEGGGLASYGPERFAVVRQAASFVDRILRGARVGDLPIEQPAKFELVINLKSARALGLTIPQALLLRADQVIE